MIKEYIVKITDDVMPDAFAWFEEHYLPEMELVRCKDCKRKDTLSCPKTPVRTDDWFCADGEKR